MSLTATQIRALLNAIDGGAGDERSRRNFGNIRKLLAEVVGPMASPAGVSNRVPYYDSTGLLTNGSGLTFDSATGTLGLGGDVALRRASANALELAAGDSFSLETLTVTSLITVPNDSFAYAKLQNVSATDKVLGRASGGAGDIEEIACTAAGRALLDDADAAAQRTTLGLAIGADVQAWDADLDAIAALTSAADKLPYATGAQAWALTDLSAFARTILDDADAAAVRSTIGAGTSSYSDPLTTNGDLLVRSGGVTTRLPKGSSGHFLKQGATDQAWAGIANTDVSGLGTMAVEAASDYLTKAGNLSGLASAATARSNLGLVIGTDVAAQTHASQHLSGGSDAIKLDDLAAPDDNTDLDASTAKHGLLRKLSNVSTEYLDGTGAWSTPAATFDIGSLTLKSDIPVSSDLVALYDLSEGDNVKMTLNVLFGVIGGLGSLTAVDTADKLAIYDDSGGDAQTSTVNDLFKAVNTFTAETGVDKADVLSLYDASASAAEKCTVEELFKAANTLTAETSIATDDVLPVYDATATAARAATVANILAGVAASQSEQEAGSATNRAVTPGRQHYHPSAAKAWVQFNGTGTPAASASYNLSSITDNGTGDYTLNWTTSFSSGDYVVVGSGKWDTTAVNDHAPAVGVNRVASNPATGSCRIGVSNTTDGSSQDVVQVHIVVFGDL